jgi:hypothetical protein
MDRETATKIVVTALREKNKEKNSAVPSNRELRRLASRVLEFVEVRDRLDYLTAHCEETTDSQFLYLLVMGQTEVGETVKNALTALK